MKIKTLFVLAIIEVNLLVITATNAASATYTYDDLNRLTHVTNDDGSGIIYSYDEIGNRTAVTAPPIAPVQINPTGNGISTTPVYTFNAVSGATSYDIFLWIVATSTAVSNNYTAAQANCPSGTGQCAITQTPALANGAYAWYVRGENLAGVGPWSPSSGFNVGSLPAPVQISPSGNGISRTPIYTFNAVSGATSYDIFLWNVTTATAVQNNYTTAQANCPSGTGKCTVTQAPALASGPYSWYVRSESGFGAGPWSTYLSFSIP